MPIHMDMVIQCLHQIFKNGLGREGLGRESFVREKKVQEIQRLTQKTVEDMEMFRLRKKQQFSDKRIQRDFRKCQLACEDLDNKMVNVTCKICCW